MNKLTFNASKSICHKIVTDSNGKKISYGYEYHQTQRVWFWISTQKSACGNGGD